MTESDKTWSEPKLVVVARSNLEEFVLVTCKAHPNTYEGPTTTDILCGKLPGCPFEGCEGLNAS